MEWWIGGLAGEEERKEACLRNRKLNVVVEGGRQKIVERVRSQEE